MTKKNSGANVEIRRQVTCMSDLFPMRIPHCSMAVMSGKYAHIVIGSFTCYYWKI